MDIKFQKLYRYERLREHCQIAIPFAKGALMQEKKVQVLQNGQCMPSQKKVTSRYEDGSEGNSTGCGDMNAGSVDNELVYHTYGINELPEIEKECPVSGIRTCTGQSNYKTKFSIGRDGHPVCEVVDAAFLVGEMHEHFTEVLYGTFFADRTDRFITRQWRIMICCDRTSQLLSGNI